MKIFYPISDLLKRKQWQYTILYLVLVLHESWISDGCFIRDSMSVLLSFGIITDTSFKAQGENTECSKCSVSSFLPNITEWVWSHQILDKPHEWIVHHFLFVISIHQVLSSFLLHSDPWQSINEEILLADPSVVLSKSLQLAMNNYTLLSGLSFHSRFASLPRGDVLWNECTWDEAETCDSSPFAVLLLPFPFYPLGWDSMCTMYHFTRSCPRLTMLLFIIGT